MKKSNFKLNQFKIEIAGVAKQFDLNQLLSLKYIEDIKSACVQMQAQITDSSSHVLGGVEGMEPVIIEIEDDDGNVLANNMVVYDVQDRVIHEGKSKVTLLLCTPDLINNTSIKVSKRFGKGEGIDIGTMVEKDILKDTLGTNEAVDFEETMNKFSFISCYWTPYTMIKWLAARAIPKTGSGTNASAGYAFFQNKFGYKFWSYDKLAQQGLTETGPNKFMVGYAEGELEDMGDKLAIDKVKVVSSNDILMGMNYGAYSSTVMTLDLADMKYEEHPFNINKYYSAVPRLNQRASTPKYFENIEEKNYSRIMSKLLDTALFTEGTFTQDTTKITSQSALREKLFYNKAIEIEFIGKLDYTVGEVVELFSPSGGDNPKKKDKSSGKYIIGRIEREFISRNDQMTTKMLLYTDAPGNY